MGVTPSELEAQLALITKAAPELRKAGVVSLSIGDIEIELAPADPPEPTSSTATPDDPDDPLKDPATYGGSVPRRRGEPVPGEGTESWPQQTAGGKPIRAPRTS